MFASKEDIQVWLRDDTISVDDANSAKPNLEAWRLIKGQLSGVFSVAVIQSWVDPANTPSQIRSIAGRLAAAFLYRTLLSIEYDREVAAYAKTILDEAMALIAQIEAGSLIVVDDTDTPIDTTGQGLLSFWPTNETAPKFSMDQEFS